MTTFFEALVSVHLFAILFVVGLCWVHLKDISELLFRLANEKTDLVQDERSFEEDGTLCERHPEDSRRI